MERQQNVELTEAQRQTTSYNHTGETKRVTPSGSGCRECLETSDSWVHLRVRLSCGHVGCCDSSKNRRATEHFRETQHPIVRSFEPGEAWAYCYKNEALF